MHLPLVFAAHFSLFGGLGVPELIVILIILIVFLSRYAVTAGSRLSEGHDNLGRREVQILVFIGIISFVGIAIVIWPRLTR